VGLGAFAAHALKNSLSPGCGVYRLLLSNAASLALFGVALLARRWNVVLVAGSLFAIRVLLFLGSGL
jgi:uncharacterized membrane protein YgdD (TMEM256/DUF423 family)